jgi:hypothetical protein
MPHPSMAKDAVGDGEMGEEFCVDHGQGKMRITDHWRVTAQGSPIVGGRGEE